MPQKEVKTIIFKVTLDNSEAKKQADELDKYLRNHANKIKDSFSGLGDSISASFNVLKDISSTVGNAFAPIIDFGVNAVKESISLEDALNGVKKTGNLTAEQIAILTEKVRAYSTDVLKGFGSSQQLAQALEMAGSQGILTAENFNQMSGDALKWAGTMVKASIALEGLDLTTASERLGLFHGTFSDSVATIENAGSVLNHFGNVSKRGADFVLDLGLRLADASKFLKLSEESTLALAAAFSDTTMSAEQAGTAVSKIMIAMRMRSNEFAQAFQMDAATFSNLVRTDIEGAISMFSGQLDKLGQSNEGIDIIGQALSDLSLKGDGATKALLSLGEKSQLLNEYFKQGHEEWIKNISLTNEFINAADKTSTLWTALGTIFSNTTGVIGDALLPIMKELLIDVNAQAAAFSQWFRESSFIKDTLPPILQQVKGLLSELVVEATNFLKSFDFTTASAQAAEFLRNVDWREVLTSILALAQNLFTFLIQTLPTVLDLVTSMMEAWAKIEPVITPLFKVLSAGLQGLTDQLTAPFDAINALGDAITKIIEKIPLIGGVAEKISGFFGSTKTGADQAVQGVDALKQSIDATAQSTQQAEYAATGGSWLPDMVSWTDKARNDVAGLTSAISQSATAAAQASAQIAAQAQSALTAQQAYVQSQGSNASQGAKDVLAARERIAGTATPTKATAAKTYGSGIKEISPGVWSNIAREVDKANSRIVIMNSVISNVQKSMEGVANTAYKHSLFPELVSWSDKAAQGIAGVATQTQTVTDAMKQVSQAMPTTGDQDRQSILDSFKNWVPREGTIIGKTSSLGERMMEQMAQGRGKEEMRNGIPTFILENEPAKKSSGVTINYNGMTMVDESSQRRMVTQISNVQKAATSRTVTTR